MVSGNTTIDVPSYNGLKSGIHQIVRPAHGVLQDKDVALRREFFGTLKRTLSLLNRLADTDYGEAAQEEFKGIGAKFTSIAGRFSETEKSRNWQSVSNGLGLFFKVLVDGRREDAIRSALLELTKPERKVSRLLRHIGRPILCSGRR